MHPEGTGGGPELSTYEVYVCIFPLTEFITSYFAILPNKDFSKDKKSETQGRAVPLWLQRFAEL